LTAQLVKPRDLAASLPFVSREVALPSCDCSSAVFPAFRSLISVVAMAESRSMVLSHELAAALSEPGAVIPLTCESVLSTIENSFSSPETLFEVLAGSAVILALFAAQILLISDL
jgi:hypothetical protein